MSDKNKEARLDEFLRKELAGVDLEGVHLEPGTPIEQSSKDLPEGSPTMLTRKDLDDDSSLASDRSSRRP